VGAKICLHRVETSTTADTPQLNMQRILPTGLRFGYPRKAMTARKPEALNTVIRRRFPSRAEDIDAMLTQIVRRANRRRRWRRLVDTMLHACVASSPFAIPLTSDFLAKKAGKVTRPGVDQHSPDE
jgi:hypothetical protein